MVTRHQAWDEKNVEASPRRMPISVLGLGVLVFVSSLTLYQTARRADFHLSLHTTSKDHALPTATVGHGLTFQGQADVGSLPVLAEESLIKTGQSAVQAVPDFEKQQEGQGAESGSVDKASSSSSSSKPTSSRDSDLNVPKPVRSKYLHVMERDDIYPLTKGGVLFASLGNHHYTSFVLNWVYFMHKANITNYLVGALDEDLVEILLSRQIHTILVTEGRSKGAIAWGGEEFHASQRTKLDYILDLLRFDIQVFVSDVDVIWFRNPMPFIQRFPEADLLISSDTPYPSVGRDEALEKYHAMALYFNVGIVLYRKGSIPLLEHWADVLTTETLWDQDVLDKMLRSVLKPQVKPWPVDPKNYFPAWDRTIKAGILPVAYFAGGQVYFVEGLPKSMGVDPYCAHNTFVSSGHIGKITRFREALLWMQDPTSYYNVKGGFLAYAPSIPQDLLNRSVAHQGNWTLGNFQGHFELVNHQLTQVRTALALATVLNRTLVLPEFWCGSQHYYGPHDGHVPYSRGPLPYKCPPDLILDLIEGLEGKWSEANFGPYIPWRESSFLKNPKLPARVLEQAVTVDICPETQASGCADGSGAAAVHGRHVRIQPDLDSDQIRRALSSVQEAPLLQFTTMHGAFGNFTSPEVYSRFLARTSMYTTFFCCADLPKGHVHYDMWWDTPHRDRYGRYYNGTWYARPGEE